MFQKPKEYYHVLGEFMTKFSSMETSLVSYCSIIKYLCNYQEGFDEFSPLSISDRLKYISKFIKESLPELQNDWNKIVQKINEVNENRRHLIHGIGRASFYTESITTHVPKKGKTVSKDFSIEDINKIIDNIEHICTGDNGIQGEFHNNFCISRYDYHNERIDASNKIVYRLNGVAVTKFKGEANTN